MNLLVTLVAMLLDNLFYLLILAAKIVDGDDLDQCPLNQLIVDLVAAFAMTEETDLGDDGDADDRACF